MDGPPPRAGEEGFTLIELLISLLLFALIAVAGIALVDSVLGVQGRTEARLDRLAGVQRAMLVLSGDIAQVAAGDVTGGGPVLAFRRAAPGVGGIALDVRYGLAGDTLVRVAGAGPQVVLTGVSAVRFRFWNDGWSERWPVAEPRDWPRAVEVTIALDGTPPAGVRRVVLLPERAPDVT